MVLAFHGSGGHARNMVSLSRTYTEQSMIIVAPEARETRYQGACSIRWRQIGIPAANWEDLERKDNCAGGTLADDLDFTRALLDHFEASERARNFYALGFSNGAGFVFQLYNTIELAVRFSGFAAAGNGMISAKRASLKSKPARYAPNKSIARPFLFQMGTNDKRNLAVEEIIEAIETNPKCDEKRGVKDVMSCFISSFIDGEQGVYDMPTTLSLTRDWLVGFNYADRRRQEGLYPNLGQGPNPDDITITVREDYLTSDHVRSAPVAILTTVDGGHEWPGWGGNRAPCPSENCDVDLMHEIIQFWRANASMVLPLP